MSGINDKHHFHSPVSNNAGHGKKSHQPEDGTQLPVEQAVVRHEGKAPDAIFAALQQQSSGALNNVTVGRLQALFSGDFHKRATQAIDIAAKELGLDPHNVDHAMLLSDIAVGAL